MADLRLSSGIGESTPRDAALFLLGPSGVILHANERGADMLAEGSVVRLAAAGRLALQAETAQAIANHVLAASGTSRLAAGQRLDRAGLPEGLAGHVVPVSTEAGLTGLAGTMAWSVTEAAAAVMVLKGQPRTETLRDRLRRAFSMTEAEAAVAEGIHAGLTLNDIALLRGVTINTIRNQTKLALSKAGVHRQADLVRVVDRLT
jgi:DNA-binding NarL/FixJ family response regulator